MSIFERDRNGNHPYHITVASKRLANGKTEWYSFQTGALPCSEDRGSRAAAYKHARTSILRDCGHNDPTIYWKEIVLEPETAPEPRRKMVIKGQEYEVPTVEELKEWIADCGCMTPDGEWVEPDSPDSWLRILGMI